MKCRICRFLLLGINVLFVIGLFTFILLSQAEARNQTTCDVPSPSYSTIQSAVDDANCDIIHLTGTLYNENLTIDRPVTIQGQGNDYTTIDGSNIGRVIDIQNSTAVTLTNLAVTNGFGDSGAGIALLNSSLTLSNVAVLNNATQNVPFKEGGGLFAFADEPGHQLLIYNSRFGGNYASGGGGGLYFQEMEVTIEDSVFDSNSSETCAAIENIDNILGAVDTSLAVKNSLFISNTSLLYGGGICSNFWVNLSITNSLITNNSAGDEGGGIWHNGTGNIFQSTVSGNSADGGGGIFNNTNAILYIDSSTISGNSGRMNYSGGAINNHGGHITVTNSTVSGNSAGYGGGFTNSFPEGTTTFLFSTLTGNSANNLGGAIFSTDGYLSLSNNIIANSPSGGDCVAGATIILNSNNLIEDGSCSGAISGDPALGLLQDNGGPTLTHELLEGSIAIDAGDNNICPSLDQRGVYRPIDGDGNGDSDCDIGAYEFGIPAGFIYFPVIRKT